MVVMPVPSPCWCLIQVRIENPNFPGGPLVENLPAGARGMGSIPGPGRFHMPWSNKSVHHNNWSPHLEPVLHNKRSCCDEKPAHCN